MSPSFCGLQTVSDPCLFALFPFPDRSLSLCAPAHQHPLQGHLFLLSQRIPSAVSMGESLPLVHSLPSPSLTGPPSVGPSLPVPPARLLVAAPSQPQVVLVGAQHLRAL